MIEDISTTKDLVKEEQIKTCDICNNEINTLMYLDVSSSTSKNKNTNINNNKNNFSTKHDERYKNLNGSIRMQSSERRTQNENADGQAVFVLHSALGVRR